MPVIHLYGKYFVTICEINVTLETGFFIFHIVRWNRKPRKIQTNSCLVYGHTTIIMVKNMPEIVYKISSKEAATWYMLKSTVQLICMCHVVIWQYRLHPVWDDIISQPWYFPGSQSQINYQHGPLVNIKILLILLHI